MFKLRPALACLALAAAALGTPPAAAGCVVDDPPDAVAAGEAGPAAQAAADARLQIAKMVRGALLRSQAVGAARLLAEAAGDDLAEARAAHDLQASLSAGFGPNAAFAGSEHETNPLRASMSLGISRLLYDGGRSDRLADWREQLAESARQGQIGAQEEVAASTVALVFERSRWQMQSRVYGQYVGKMACLVDSLETIVRADRGRGSELVQARKSLQQAELAQSQAQSQVRQVEVRLRRLVGDELPPVEGISGLLATLPDLASLQDEVVRSAEVAQLDAQAAAARHYAAAVQAGGRPQLSWNAGAGVGGSVGGSEPLSRNRSGSLSVGIAVSIPLATPGLDAASDAATRRALAAEMQRAEVVDSRRSRVAELHEQVASAFDRARRIDGVLRDSDQVRGFTLQQWQQLGRRSLFDVMAAEGEHYSLRVARVNALHDAQELNAVLMSLGRGVQQWLRQE